MPQTCHASPSVELHQCTGRDDRRDRRHHNLRQWRPSNHERFGFVSKRLSLVHHLIYKVWVGWFLPSLGLICLMDAHARLSSLVQRAQEQCRQSMLAALSDPRSSVQHLALTIHPSHV